MGILTMAEFLEIDRLEDSECELPFKGEVLPTVLLLSAIIRHARNDLNTRAYHRAGCCYYRGIMFEYHVELLQACFAASGLPFEGITANNARREAEVILGLETGYLEPQYIQELNNPGAAACAALDIYKVTAKNKCIAESVLAQHMPALLSQSPHFTPSDEELEWLERHYEQKKHDSERLGKTAHFETAFYDAKIEHYSNQTEEEIEQLNQEWSTVYMPENQMELWE